MTDDDLAFEPDNEIDGYGATPLGDEVAVDAVADMTDADPASDKPDADDDDLAAAGDEALPEPTAEEAVETPESPPAAEPTEEEATEEEREESTPEAPARIRRLVRWPFLVYAILWAVLIGVAFALLYAPGVGLPAFGEEYYPYVLFAGLALTALGPLTAIAVWLVSRSKVAKAARSGLLTSALLYGSLITFVGVASWWAALVAIDALRLGLL